MKKLVLAASLATFSVLAQGAAAQEAQPIYDYEPTGFVGLTWTFGPNGGQPGISAKLLSTNEPDVVGFAAGVTYNFDGSFGCDAGLAMNSGDVAATLTYDICQGAPQVGLGMGLTDPEMLEEGN